MTRARETGSHEATSLLSVSGDADGAVYRQQRVESKP